MEKNQQEKLLVFAKPNDIKKTLGAQTYYTMLATLEIKLNRKPKISEIKQFMRENPSYLLPLLQNEEFLQKYAVSLENKNSLFAQEEKKRKSELRKVMYSPKQQYKGCLATKLTPEDYESCLVSYDDPNTSYNRYSSMVPYNALRQKEYNKALSSGDTSRAKLLELGPNVTIRDLPLGIRRYMKKNPEDFNNYLDEIKAEAKYLEAIKYNISQKPKDQRRALYEQLLGNVN